MGRLRQRGERTDVIINEIDLMILKSIITTSKDLAIMEVGEKLNLTHSSLRRHLIWLEQLKLISKIPIAQSRKIILKPTAEGRQIFKILNKNVPKDSYKH